jgi:hypothetical protein
MATANLKRNPDSQNSSSIIKFLVLKRPKDFKEGHIRQLSNWDLGRVRRVKVRPGEGVIALPYDYEAS